MKSVLIVTIGGLMGFLLAQHMPEFVVKRYHDNKIHKYVSYMRNPENWIPDQKSGLIQTGAPPVPMLSLAVLVEMGELVHLDLVFPTVAHDNVELLRYWKNFVGEHDDVVYAFGNPSSYMFAPRGEQPLHLNIWFRSSASDRVRQLINDIDEKWGK